MKCTSRTFWWGALPLVALGGLAWASTGRVLPARASGESLNGAAVQVLDAPTDRYLDLGLAESGITSLSYTPVRQAPWSQGAQGERDGSLRRDPELRYLDLGRRGPASSDTSHHPPPRNPRSLGRPVSLGESPTDF